MQRQLTLGAALLVACGAAVDDATPGLGVNPPANVQPGGDPGAYVALGLNDVSILVPPPPSGSEPLLRGADSMDDGTPLVPRDLFERLARAPIPESGSMPPIPVEVYDDLQVTAVRFDLCDRNLPGPCEPNADGRVRLVLQPLDPSGGFADIGFHAFYSVSNSELTALVKEIRALAQLQMEPITSPLMVSPALSAGKANYRRDLRALLRRRTSSSRLVRLTMNVQPLVLSQVRWVMRGVEKKDGAFIDVRIPGMTATTQEVITLGATGFESRPLADSPTGILEALDDRAFEAANETRKRELLGVLVASDNPISTAPDTIACIACHTTTAVLHARTNSMGLDAATIPGRYTSSYDLSVTGTLRDGRTIRAFGWLGQSALVSQRVINESAQVLLELEARYPAPVRP